MGVHVDVIRNDWAAKVQHRVAHVTFQHNRLRVEPLGPGTLGLEQIAARICTGPETGSEKLEKFADELIGSYLFASDIHSDDVCPFVHCDDVKMLVDEVPGLTLPG